MSKIIEVILQKDNHFNEGEDKIFLKIDNDVYEYANNFRKVTIKQFQDVQRIKRKRKISDLNRKVEYISILSGIPMTKLKHVRLESLTEIVKLLDFDRDFDFVKTINVGSHGFQFNKNFFKDEELMELIRDRRKLETFLHIVVAKCYNPIESIKKYNRLKRIFKKNPYKITIDAQNCDENFILNNFKMNHVFGLMKLFDNIK